MDRMMRSCSEDLSDYIEQVAKASTGGHYLFKFVGKKKAGRLLDSRTWDEIPGEDVSHR